MKCFCRIIIAFLSLVLLSCKSKGEGIDSLTLIDIEANMKKMEIINLSQFADNVRYVPLESDLDHALSWTWNILSDFSEKYILDSDGRICLLYDNYGHYIRQIGKQGRGPGEYTGINYVALKSEKIYLHNFYTDDLIEYKMDGTYLKMHKSGFSTDEKYRFEDAIMINDSMIFGNIENRTGKEKYKALIINKKGDVKYYYKNYTLFKVESDKKNVKAHGRATIYQFRNKIFFKEFYCDTLFLIDDQYRLIPGYVFNFGKYKEPFSKRGMDWSQKDLSLYIYLDYVYQTENFLILICNFNKYFPAKRLSPEIIKTPNGRDYTQWYNHTGQKVIGIHNKKTRTLIFSKPTSTNNQLFTSGLYNDIDAGPRFLPDKLVNDSTMVMKIRFDHLMGHIASDDFKNIIPKYPERKKRLELLVDSLIKAEFDNPVLMFVTFKNK